MFLSDLPLLLLKTWSEFWSWATKVTLGYLTTKPSVSRVACHLRKLLKSFAEACLGGSRTWMDMTAAIMEFICAMIGKRSLCSKIDKIRSLIKKAW
jgi:hypothetical protein